MRLLDLFCGRLGWSRAFAKRGWECYGIDLVEPPEIPERCIFWKMNILELHIYEGELWYHKEHYPLPDFIVASSPCEQFSVHGMKHFHPNPPYPELGIKLFNHTRELCEASGRPYVMENVKFAQGFVGHAKAHCGSFYLWGNSVPALIPRNIFKAKWTMQKDRLGNTTPLVWGSKKIRAAEFATIPIELANCVCSYAEALIFQSERSTIVT